MYMVNRVMKIKISKLRKRQGEFRSGYKVTV